MIFRCLLLLTLLTACNGQEKTTPPAAPPARSAPALNDILQQDIDPHFVSPAATESKTGPASITRNIIQDRSGDVWLATWEGIINYDGTTFTNYTARNNLRKFHVFSALEARDGNLWFGTIGAGIYRYDGEAFVNITESDGLASNRQGCFHQDRSGRIWIGTMGGISIYDGKTFRNLTTATGLPDNDINAILEDRNGKMWIASRGALCTYDGAVFTQLRREEDNATSTFSNVRTVIEDRTGNIWFGGNDGLWRYGTDGLTQFAEEFTGYIYEDSEGNIWTSSVAPTSPDEWRLSRYAAKSLNDNAKAPTVILQRKDMFFGIMEDTEGNIWLGSLRGVGRYDGSEFLDLSH